MSPTYDDHSVRCPTIFRILRGYLFVDICNYVPRCMHVAQRRYCAGLTGRRQKEGVCAVWHSRIFVRSSKAAVRWRPEQLSVRDPASTRENPA